MERLLDWALRVIGADARSRILHRLLGTHAVGVLYRTAAGPLILPPGGEPGVGLPGDGGAAPPRELDAVLTPDARVLVLGAGVGAPLLALAGRVARICGVEADPRAFDLLRANARLHGIRNAELHHFSPGDAEGVTTFDPPLEGAHAPGARRARATGAPAAAGGHGSTPHRPQPAGVRVRRVDDALPGRHFDVIIVRIPGNETPALRGMPHALAACRTLCVHYAPALAGPPRGATPEAFLATFAHHFDHGIILGDPSRVWPRDEFREMIAGLRSADLLFRKDRE